jgi:hypothetical protein
MDVDLMMMMVDYGCRIYAMAPGDELRVAGFFFWKAYLPIENTLNGKRPRIGP